MVFAIIGTQGAIAGKKGILNRGRAINEKNSITATATVSHNAAPTLTTCEECLICFEPGTDKGGICKIDDEVGCTEHDECRSGSKLCNHEFCKTCIRGLKESSAANHQQIKCPLCRMEMGCQRQYDGRQILERRRAEILRALTQLQEHERSTVASGVFLTEDKRQKFLQELSIAHEGEIRTVMLQIPRPNLSPDQIVVWWNTYRE